MASSAGSTKIWKIFARLGATEKNSEDYARECYQGGVIAVGWNEVGDLNKIRSKEELKRRLVTDSYWSSVTKRRPRRVDQWAASLWKFKESVHKGHIVLCPDRSSRLVYAGRVLSEKPHFDRASLGGKCDFAHRRKVEWFRVLIPHEIRKIWPDGRFGGRLTVTKVDSGVEHRLKSVPGKRIRKAKPSLPVRPDKEWGVAAERRAMIWLKERGYRPKNVADRNLGWDIESGSYKFEVKGRKTTLTAIRLTENEWRAARKHKEKFTLLLFTAPTEAKLKKAKPQQIPNPTQSQQWRRRITYEYVLDEK